MGRTHLIPLRGHRVCVPQITERARSAYRSGARGGQRRRCGCAGGALWVGVHSSPRARSRSRILRGAHRAPHRVPRRHPDLGGSGFCSKVRSTQPMKRFSKNSAATRKPGRPPVPRGEGDREHRSVQGTDMVEGEQGRPLRRHMLEAGHAHTEQQPQQRCCDRDPVPPPRVALPRRHGGDATLRRPPWSGRRSRSRCGSPRRRAWRGTRRRARRQ